MGKKKVVRQKESAQNSKQPKVVENPEGYLKKRPIWAFQRCDILHERWSIKRCEKFNDQILDKLISFEGQTWAEIQSASGGKAHGTNSHFVNIDKLCKEAQKRILELHLDIDQVFSLRISSTLRLFGIMDNGVFNVLWYDPNHEICPSHKRNT